MGNAPKILSTTKIVRLAFWALRTKMRASLPMLLAAITGKFWPLAELARQSSQARLGKPRSGIRCSSIAPHYLAGLREVPVEVPWFWPRGVDSLLPPQLSVSRVC